MRKCFVHVGTHKTGTTSIQMVLSGCAERLQEAGLLYPNTGRVSEPYAHHNIAWEVGAANFFRRENGGIEDLLKEIDSCEHNIILSSEDLSSLIGTPRFNKFIKTLQEHGLQVCVIVYLRNQIGYIRSLYLQGIRNGRTGPFGGFLARALEAKPLPELGINFLDYRDMLNRLKVLKDVDLIVRSYDDAQRGSLISDFLSILGLTASSSMRIRIFIRTPNCRSPNRSRCTSRADSGGRPHGASESSSSSSLLRWRATPSISSCRRKEESSKNFSGPTNMFSTDTAYLNSGACEPHD